MGYPTPTDTSARQPYTQGQRASQKKGGKVVRARGQEASARWGLPDMREKLLQLTLDNMTA